MPLSNCKPSNKDWNYQSVFLYLIAFAFSANLVKWNFKKIVFSKIVFIIHVLTGQA